MNVVFNASKFVKFPKIENLRNAREFPVVVPKTAKFYVSEKIDGCNMGMYIDLETSDVSFYSRNGMDGRNLFNFKEDCSQLDVFVNDFRNFIVDAYSQNDSLKGVWLWGEYYGDHINRRIHYGTKGSVKFYNMMYDFDDIPNEMESPSAFNCTMNDFISEYPEDEKYIHFSTPIFALIASREDLMNVFSFPMKSMFNDTEHSEGVVISTVYEGKVLLWKYKDPEFEEKPTKVKTIDPNDPRMEENFSVLHSEFKKYINVNRAVAVISKTPDRNIGNLIRLLLDDAIEEFEEVYKEELASKDKKYKKMLYNVGSAAFIAVSNALNE